MAKYEWDTSCADLELRRLGDGFEQRDFINFARVLAMGYVRAQADVHIETGSLRASMDMDVTTSTSDRWEGHISAGGTSSGEKNPVRYAASEFFGTYPKHGGAPNHSYFRRLGWNPFGGAVIGVPIEDDMLGPVTSFFSRGRNTPHPEAGQG